MKAMIIGNLPKPFGGVATHCYYLVQELVKRNVDVIFLDTHMHEEKSIPLDTQYHRLHFSLVDVLRCATKPFNIITIISKLLEFKQYAGFREMYNSFKISLKIILLNAIYNFDIIHTQHCLLRSLGAVIAGKALKLNTVITVHGGEIAYNDMYEKYQGIIHYNLEEAHAVIAVSQFTKKKILQRGIKRSIHVIYNGVDTNKYRPILKLQEKKRKRKNHIILTVAHISKRKGIDILIKSIQHIKTKNINCWIIGPPWDPGIMDELNNLIAQLNIKNEVTFFGELSDDEIIEHYNMADLFILPTAWETEGFGLVNLEAMSCAVPVVASKIGAIPEIVINGQTGKLVPPNNPIELAKSIDSLIQNPNKCMIMGMHGRKFAEFNFSWGTMAEYTKKIYWLCTMQH